MIEKIKKDITKEVGTSVRIIVNGSRNKKEEYSGVIVEIYNNIFIVKLDTFEMKSFCYSDVLTNTIEIFFDKLC